MKSKKNAMKQQEDFSMDKEKKNEKSKKVILAFEKKLKEDLMTRGCLLNYDFHRALRVPKENKSSSN
jgi:hypothetical protein